jgi:NAD-reducing hydrogenase small subunit
MNDRAGRGASCGSRRPSLAGCFGCHMSLPRHRRAHAPLLELIEFDRSPLTDIKHCGPCDLGLIEGGLCNAENVHTLREFRARTARSWSRSARARSTAACRRSATTSTCATCLQRSTWPATASSAASSPTTPSCRCRWPQVHPLHDVVKIDYFLPGCPPSADAIWQFLTDLIAGRTPHLGHGLLKYD